MHLAAPQPDVLPQGDAAVVLLRRAAQGALQRGGAASVGPVMTVLHADIVLVGQEAGQVRGGEGLQISVVIRLDGVHVVIGHLAGRVHGHLFKGDGAASVNVVVLRLRHLIVGGLVLVVDEALVVHSALGLAVEHPEGDIHALDLLDVVAIGERLGQQGLALIVVLQGSHGVLLAELEGQDEVRLQRAAELARHHGGIAAVGAGRGGGGGVADQLRAAGGAVIGLHAVGLRAPVAVEAGGIPALGLHLRHFLAVLFRLGVSLLRGGHGLGLFLRVQGFDLRHVIFRTAEITFQHTGGACKVQGAGTCRAFIVGNLGCHYSLLSATGAALGRSRGKWRSDNTVSQCRSKTEVIRASSDQLAVVAEEQGQAARVILGGVPGVYTALVLLFIPVLGAIHADMLLQVRIGQL